MWWMVAAGAAIGFAFLTKMLQGLLVLPGFVLAYLIASRHSLMTRIGHLLAASGSMIVSAGWFITLVSLWPAAKRAYIGGSTNNPVGTGAGLQRLGPHLRRLRQWWRRGWPGRWLRRQHRHLPDVQQPVRYRDQLVPARHDHPAGRRFHGPRPCLPHRPFPRLAGALGRLDALHRAGTQLHAGHRALLLRRRPDPGGSPPPSRWPAERSSARACATG
ncbi:glycosyltransferase family 39 protein [Luteococcus sp. H138]|uniref:glycosyltransferase family 39 protein n=1 Tax=unclassified Luteococcus TaxID=2639923 RepID=UPI00313A9EE0